MEIKMKDFRPFWKTLANEKAITRRNVIQHIILRTMRSKSEDKQAVLHHLLHKAFTPLKYASDPFRAITEQSVRLYGPNSLLLGTPAKEILTDEEIQQFNILADNIAVTKLLRNYSYFFTRQDISPEYQLVQTAHAALELGNTLTPEQVKNLHFTCIGVADGEELDAVEHLLKTLGLRYVAFREPDFGNRITSIAVEPIAENSPKRRPLRSYELLSFQRKEEIILQLGE